jgi:hypothetical protein
VSLVGYYLLAPPPQTMISDCIGFDTGRCLTAQEIHAQYKLRSKPAE